MKITSATFERFIQATKDRLARSRFTAEDRPAQQPRVGLEPAAQTGEPHAEPVDSGSDEPQDR